MSKIVFVSDVHADWSTLGVSRFREIASAVEQSVDHAIAIGARSFIFAGDLADPDTGGATFKAQALAIESALRLTRAGISSIWLRGNHDVCEDGSGACVLSPMRPLEQMTANAGGPIWIADHPRVISLFHDLSVLCLPFMPVSHGVDMAEYARANWPTTGRVMVLSHLTIPGITVGEETLELPRGRDVLLPLEETKRAAYRISGHYHRRQIFDPGDGGPEIIVIGAPARLSFGEEDHDPAFVVLDVNPG
jgi:DNA repair exonuclease SbcCD nuclease subunit